MLRVLLVSVLLLLTGPLYAQPRDAVLRLVPTESSLCFLLQNLRDHSDRLRESPFIAKLARSSFGTGIRNAPEWGQLEAIDGFLQAQIGVSAEAIYRDIFGDAVALCYQPPTPDRPNDERTIMLMWVRKPKLIQDMIAKLDRLEGVKQTREKEHAGRKYFHRIKAEGDEFFFVLGNVFGFSDREDVVQLVLTADRDRPALSEQTPRLSQELLDLGVADTLFCAWMNPRGFDADLQTRVEQTRGGERSFLEQFFHYWRAVDSAALYFRMDQDLSFGISLRVRNMALPETARRFFELWHQPSPLLNLAPNSALMVAGMRVDSIALFRTLSDFFAPEARKGVQDFFDTDIAPLFGRNAWKSVIAAIGPDIALWSMPRPADANSAWPAFTLALRINDPTAEKPVLQALDQLAFLLRYEYNRKHTGEDQLQLDEQRHGDLTIRFLSNEQRFPKGFRPAFAIKSGLLLIADSPETIADLRIPAIDWKQPVERSPLVRLSFRAVRAHLEQHRRTIETALNGNATMLDDWLATMQLFDQIEVIPNTGPKSSRLELRWRFSEPLQK